MNTRPIVIIGTPRSGTSLTAGIIHACGVWFGSCRPPSKDNRKGHFENLRLEDLRKRGVLTPSNVERVLLEEGWRGGPWGNKCTPSGIASWRPFRPMWVFVHRPKADILASRVRTGWYEESEQAASDRVDAHLALMRSQGDRLRPIVNVRADELISSRQARMDLIASLDLEYDDRVDDFVDADLWKTGQGGQEE